ncbi:MAG: hypothetical protein AB1705_03315, partial [Verrucomicrobiota bacterium]
EHSSLFLALADEGVSLVKIFLGQFFEGTYDVVHLAPAHGLVVISPAGELTQAKTRCALIGSRWFQRVSRRLSKRGFRSQFRPACSGAPGSRLVKHGLRKAHQILPEWEGANRRNPLRFIHLKLNGPKVLPVTFLGDGRLTPQNGEACSPA